MNARERVVIDLALQVLQEAIDAGKGATGNTTATRLALRVLLPHCPEKWPLSNFWDSSGQDNEIGRQQGMTAAFNGIMRQLEKSGAVEG
jgi:hypothetical protein